MDNTAQDLYYGFDSLNDYERGEFDCIHGYPANANDSDEYYVGYGTTYGIMETNTTRYKNYGYR